MHNHDRCAGSLNDAFEGREEIADIAAPVFVALNISARRVNNDQRHRRHPSNLVCDFLQGTAIESVDNDAGCLIIGIEAF